MYNDFFAENKTLINRIERNVSSIYDENAIFNYWSWEIDGCIEDIDLLYSRFIKYIREKDKKFTGCMKKISHLNPDKIRCTGIPCHACFTMVFFRQIYKRRIKVI